jgi:hypothetical protein
LPTPTTYKWFSFLKFHIYFLFHEFSLFFFNIFPRQSEFLFSKHVIQLILFLLHAIWSECAIYDVKEFFTALNYRNKILHVDFLMSVVKFLFLVLGSLIFYELKIHKCKENLMGIWLRWHFLWTVKWVGVKCVESGFLMNFSIIVT